MNTSAPTDDFVREIDIHTLLPQQEPMVMIGQLMHFDMQRKKLIDALKKEMSDCAERLEYEQAAAYRDQILELEKFDKR